MSQNITQTPPVLTRVSEVTAADIEAVIDGQLLRVVRPHRGSSWYEPGTLTYNGEKAGLGPLHYDFNSDFGGHSRLPRGDPKQAEVLAKTAVKVIDPDGDQEVPLVPIFGALATLALVLPGVDPAEALPRLERALEREFGADTARILRSKARPTPDIRIDVTQTDHDGVEKVRAVGILADEASYLVPMPFTTRLHAPESDENVIVGR